MPIAKRNLRSILLGLGFTEVRGSHHIFFERVFPGRLVRTRISHGGSSDIGDALLAHILRRQLFMTRAEFEQARRGNMSAEDYTDLLVQKGIIAGGR
jgi:predicted RNA binding protein YcfA (HicA-like mRNA interferase family)